MTINLTHLKNLKNEQQKIVCLTAYDAAFGHCLSEAGVDVILVGDSLGMVVQGHKTTLPVTIKDMIYHTKMVQRGNSNAWCIADIPFMADATLEQALTTTRNLLQAGANMVKLEGGGQRVVKIVENLSKIGVPVCGHLGLQPQSVQKVGYKFQATDKDSADILLQNALELEQAGMDILVLECVPEAQAKHISQTLSVPVIGIGSGLDTDGQILVLHDILGITIGKTPKFSQNFMHESNSIMGAVEAYAQAVRSKKFPAKQHILK